HACGSRSRWSAPRSTTLTSGGSAAASAADSPCGRARKTRSDADSGPAPVGTSSTSSPARCGCTAPTDCPALVFAVAATRSSCGCPTIRRRSSPPAYPLAPATATRIPMHPPAFLCRRTLPRLGQLAVIEVHRLGRTRFGIAEPVRLVEPAGVGVLAVDVDLQDLGAPLARQPAGGFQHRVPVPPPAQLRLHVQLVEQDDRTVVPGIGPAREHRDPRRPFTGEEGHHGVPAAQAAQ